MSVMDNFDCESRIKLVKKLTTMAPDINDFDAVLGCVSNMDKVHELIYNDYTYTINTTATIDVGDDITFELEPPVRVNDKPVELAFVLRTTRGINHLKSFIRKCREDYEIMRNNKLGAELYYFDQIVHPDARDHLIFVKTRFETGRTFDNIYFEGKEELRARVEHFLTRPDWYAKRGIPHTLGVITYGEPGCGKTSTNKAIAKMSARHVINVKFSDIRTKTQLKNLFYSPLLHVHNNETNKTEVYKIPINRRYYQIEDIDCMGDIVLRREYRMNLIEAKEKSDKSEKTEKPETDKPDKTDKFDKEDELFDIKEFLKAGMKKDIQEEKAEMLAEDGITLDDLLNIFDGTLEIPGRMLSITTNHIDMIDPALIRPGRIDKIVHFLPCNAEVARQMFEGFYEQPFDIKAFEGLQKHHVSQAKVNQIMFNNMNTPYVAISELITESKKRNVKKTRRVKQPSPTDTRKDDHQD